MLHRQREPSPPPYPLFRVALCQAQTFVRATVCPDFLSAIYARYFAYFTQHCVGCSRMRVKPTPHAACHPASSHHTCCMPIAGVRSVCLIARAFIRSHDDEFSHNTNKRHTTRAHEEHQAPTSCVHVHTASRQQQQHPTAPPPPHIISAPNARSHARACAPKSSPHAHVARAYRTEQQQQQHRRLAEQLGRSNDADARAVSAPDAGPCFFFSRPPPVCTQNRARVPVVSHLEP